MARYIDADKLLEVLNEELMYESTMHTEEHEEYLKKGLRVAICDVKRFPTADVVPKSEVEKAKAEVARANAMGKAMLLDAIDTFRNLLCIESWLDYEDERKHYIVSVDDVNRIHDELKKKYTGDQT